MVNKIKENIKLVTSIIAITAFLFGIGGFVIGVYVTHDLLGDDIVHNKELLQKIDRTVSQHNILLMNLRPHSMIAADPMDGGVIVE